MIQQDIRTIDAIRPERSLIVTAAQILRNGGIIVAPTETQYGLMANIDDNNTIKRLFDLKHREKTAATAIFVRGLDEISRFAYESPLSKRFAANFLPGPLTLVLRAKAQYSSPIVVEGKIGIRYSSSAVVGGILDQLNFRLTATSANVSGKSTPAEISTIAMTFGDEVDLYLDAGPLKSLFSTVVDCSGEGYRVLRYGVITENMIIESLQNK